MAVSVLTAGLFLVVGEASRFASGIPLPTGTHAGANF